MFSLQSQFQQVVIWRPGEMFSLVTAFFNRQITLELTDETSCNGYKLFHKIPKIKNPEISDLSQTENFWASDLYAHFKQALIYQEQSFDRSWPPNGSSLEVMSYILVFNTSLWLLAPS